eukprot:422864-Pelagomonas_calceolata.AAC.4
MQHSECSMSTNAFTQRMPLSTDAYMRNRACLMNTNEHQCLNATQRMLNEHQFYNKGHAY